MWFVLKTNQIPQYLEPCGSFLTYWSKSSNFCRWPVKIAYFRKHKKDYGILSFWFRHILAKRKVLRYLFAFIVCHCNVVVDSTFWNTFFPTYRACVLKHARIMNALNMIACRNSARKPLHIISCRKCLITISTEIGNWPREMNIFYVLSQVALVPACFPT